MRGDEKWRWDGTGTPEGWLGGEGIPRPKEEIGGPLGGQRIKREFGQVSPAHMGPQEPAGIPGLILCPPRPLPAAWVLKEWEGRESKSKGQTSRTSTPEGWLGEGRSSYTQQDTPTVRGPVGTGQTLGETLGGARRNGRERGQCFPCPLRHWGACWAHRPNPLPSEPPSYHEEPKTCPCTPT